MLAQGVKKTIFSANLTLLFNEFPFLERFEQAKLAGFSAVECLFPYEYSPQDIASKLNEHQLELALFNLPPGNWSQGERGLASLPGREEEFKESIQIALKYALSLQCQKIHAMAGVRDIRFSNEQHMFTFIKNIRYAADVFVAKGIEVMIEPINHQDMPGYFISHQLEAIDLLARINRDNVRLQFDCYHAQIMDGNITTLLRKCAAHIGHVQIASVPDRHEPNCGELNLSHLLEVLNEIGYRGWIGCEYRPKTSTEEGLSWLKPYILSK